MTQKNKNITLLIVIVVVFIIAYQYAFSNTFALKYQYNRLQKDADVSTVRNQLHRLNQKERVLDSILRANSLENASIQNSLLDYLSQASQESSVKIISFEKPVKVTSENLKSNTIFTFQLSGSYRDLEQVLVELEQEHAFGNIIHSSFITEKNYRRNRTDLICTVVLRSL